MDYKQMSMQMFETESPAPLADRVRPKTLDEFVGQRHLLDRGKALRNLIDTDNIGSMIFWGPPGVGNTNSNKKHSASTDRVNRTVWLTRLVLACF